MAVKVGDTRSTPRNVNAGAPQGSVLGTYVFNIATDDLEDGVGEDHEENDEYELNDGDLAFLETYPDTNTATSTPIRTCPHPLTNASPIGGGGADQFVILEGTRNVPNKLTHRIEPTWRKRQLTVRKFVDDNLQLQKLNMKKQRTYMQNNVKFKNPRVMRSEKMFKHIAGRAYRKGLRVNAAKTNLLVVSASNSYEARAHFYDDQNTRIDCQNTLKALGFTFNARGDVSTQVEILTKKFRQKVWTLRHLRKNNFTEEELLRVYKTHIRPTIEYSVPVYHPMLSKEQATKIERQQYFALRNIYGFVYSNRELLELSALPTLEQRRHQMTLKFAQKTAANPRFKHWFPVRRSGARRQQVESYVCLLYTSPSPRDRQKSRMPSSA